MDQFGRYKSAYAKFVVPIAVTFAQYINQLKNRVLKVLG